MQKATFSAQHDPIKQVLQGGDCSPGRSGVAFAGSDCQGKNGLVAVDQKKGAKRSCKIISRITHERSGCFDDCFFVKFVK